MGLKSAGTKSRISRLDINRWYRIIIFNRRGFSSVSIDDTGCASNDCFFFVSTSNGQLG
ncbi:hypothetical protein DY000_02033090 [Brassica cretica]|uniref:Uncharacterized protein n=1 Tax=Brassica cretica TaxID=69181 RepID=A0ABQ7DSX1_BRACR|nr:hypothetical protein DY000_02033090 [Brassica cretica]